MIEPGRAVEIVSGILPRMRRFPRSASAQVATLAECGKLLADRCETEQQAADFSREFSNRPGWHGTGEFEAWLDSRTANIPLADLRSYAAHAHNAIIEALRCRDKFIGWCGKPYPPELIARGQEPHLTLKEQAELGRACMEHERWAEAEALREIEALPPEQRAALEKDTRRDWTGTVEAHPEMLPLCMAWSFTEWRKTVCA